MDDFSVHSSTLGEKPIDDYRWRHKIGKPRRRTDSIALTVANLSAGLRTFCFDAERQAGISPETGETIRRIIYQRDRAAMDNKPTIVIMK